MKTKEMQDLRKELGLTYEMIAERAQMPVSTVQKVLGGITKSPRRDTLIKLEKVLKDEQGSRYTYSFTEDPPLHAAEAEPAEVYDPGLPAIRRVPAQEIKVQRKNQGEYTIEDYYRLSEDRRMELINGYIYDLSAPDTVHQTIIMYISSLLWTHAMKSGFRCRPLASPVDVRLHRDSKTMIQPDIIAICENDAEDTGVRIEGAPDFVIEVLSPSTRVRDLSIKLAEYKRAGVREYWIIDPDKQTITVHLFENAGDLREYTFEEKVPVAISNGEVEVDFPELKKILEGYYGTQNAK